MSTVVCHVSTLDKAKVLARVPVQEFAPAEGRPDDNTIILDPAEKGQPILGFGGNLTDTDVYNLLRMSEGERDRVLELLFDPEKGAGWNFMRVPFGSTDWERDFDFYTYDDRPEGEKDWELLHFSVQRDIDRGFFALLRTIRERYPAVELLASVWGLPGWMKSNDSILGGIFLPEYAGVYAKYLRMAVQAFEAQGVPLYAVTTQNEPMSSDFPNNNRGTPCTRFTWRLQRPVLLALRGEFDAHGIGTRIWAYDHNYDMAEVFVDPLLADGEVRAAIDGVAFHPYRGDPAVLSKYDELYPEMPLYSTEKTVHGPGGMDEMLRQLRHGARCYILWSFFEDTYGGPHQLIGTAFKYSQCRKGQPTISMVHSDPVDGDDWDTSGDFGLFAQFSRFLQRGMRRIGCSYGHKKWVTATAFQGEDGHTAVVAVNQTGTAQSFLLRCGGKALGCAIPAMSAATYEFTADAPMLDGSVAVADTREKCFYEAPVWDLFVKEITFDGPAKAGEELRFSAEIGNEGNAPTPPGMTATIDILLDGDLRIGRIYATIPVMQPGETMALPTNAPVYDVSGTGCKTTWTATAGWHTVMALLNTGNSYPPEENEYNNRCCREFFFEE